MRIGCVVMAAGDARRFGENKLAAVFDGRTLIRHALEAVPAEEFSTVAVVTQYPEVEALAGEFGFLGVRTPTRTGASATPSVWDWRRWGSAMRCCSRFPTSPCCGGRPWRPRWRSSAATRTSWWG